MVIKNIKSKKKHIYFEKKDTKTPFTVKSYKSKYKK